MRERLIELICNAKRDDPETGSFVEFLADYLLDNGVMALPCKVGNIIDTIISHNTEVALWIDTNRYYSDLIWEGMAWDIPEEYKKMSFKRIIGVIPDADDRADAINILVERSEAE